MHGRTHSAAVGTPSVPDIRRVYHSATLFPTFTNRLRPSSRSDYPDLLRWLDVPEADASPLVILARSGGQRVTDSLEVFTSPESVVDGVYEIRFFLHGLSHNG